MSDLRYRLASLLSGRGTPSAPHRITLYTKSGCHLCETAKEVLMQARTRTPFEYEEVDITSDDTLFQKYSVHIPVVLIDGVERFRYHVNERRLMRELSR